mmetsp:Transcript_6837/g.12859  ORF Transcript_6837/g.12859 Transcript_6837/m.12859 type:complete len:204 (-) Transcript_6837:2037-2648(-)
MMPAPATPQHFCSRSVIFVTALVICSVSYEPRFESLVSFSGSFLSALLELLRSNADDSSSLPKPTKGFSANRAIAFNILRKGARTNLLASARRNPRQAIVNKNKVNCIMNWLKAHRIIMSDKLYTADVLKPVSASYSETSTKFPVRIPRTRSISRMLRSVHLLFDGKYSSGAVMVPFMPQRGGSILAIIRTSKCLWLGTFTCV